MASRLCYWFTELGIKQIHISPDVNYTNAVHADKWIPVLPNTDAALQLAIAYTWIKEGTYDQAYLDTHAVGFENFRHYVLGGEDGVPKTPKWAERICGVPSYTIKALARYWAAHAVSIAHCNGGSFIRSCFAHEPARLEVALLGMQGVGKPGANQFKFMEWTLFGIPTLDPLPPSVHIPSLGAAYRGYVTGTKASFIPKTMIPEAIMNPPVSVVRAYRGRLPARGPVRRALHVPARGRQPHPYGVVGLPLLGDLLERRLQDAGRPAPRVHRVRGRAASLDGERHPVRRYHPALQHEVRDGGHRHRLRFRPVERRVLRAPSHPAHRRVEVRQGGRRRGCPRARAVRRRLRGHAGQVPGRQDRRRVDQGRLRDERRSRGPRRSRSSRRGSTMPSPRARTGRTSPPASASSTTTPRGTRCARRRASWSTTQPRSRATSPTTASAGPSRTGSTRAPATRSASTWSAGGSTPSCSSRTTRTSACTRSMTTSPGSARSRPAR